MKSIKFLFLFVSLTAFSQSKVGAVDVDYILAKMPEMDSVQINIETYAKQLDIDLNAKIEAYSKLAEAYKTEEATYTDTVKKEKQAELLNMQADIQKFQENGTKLIAIKREEFLRPLYAKIGEALEKVARAQGFTQVHLADATVVYLDPKFDLTLPIIQELGIVIKEEN